MNYRGEYRRTIVRSPFQLIPKHPPRWTLKQILMIGLYPIAYKKTCAKSNKPTASNLSVYTNGVFVEPKDVNGVLANALAEIHFSLKHYRIQHKDEKGFNSFTTTIKQIIVLKSGVPKSRSAYKHDNPRSVYDWSCSE